MAKKPASLKFGGIGSDAVKAKTGKDWEEWIRLLDKAKAHTMSHKDIAVIVHEKFGVGDWWSQMVTVGYEQAKGMRKVHETPAGFSASISRTFNVPIDALYDWWEDDRKRKKWLPLKIIIHKATKDKSMRITMPDGTKNVSVNFYAKGDGKSQAALQQDKMKDAKAVSAAKKLWSKAFTDLKNSLEI